MAVRFIARSLSRSPLMTNVRAGTLSFKAFVVCNLGFIPLYCLIHLMQGQLAMPGYLRELAFPILGQVADGAAYCCVMLIIQ